MLLVLLTLTGATSASTASIKVAGENAKVNRFGVIYYTIDGNLTKELYIGGYIHFPKKLADRIKVTGGAIEQEDETGWKIKVTSPSVTVEYVKLTDRDFGYFKKIFVAKEYPAELLKPVKPDEMRLTLINLSKKVEDFREELKKVRNSIEVIAEKPTVEEQLMGFLLYFPPMWVVYALLGTMGFLIAIGWWYERN